MAQQKNGAQINAVTNRIDLNIKTPSAASSFRNALGIISCRGPVKGVVYRELPRQLAKWLKRLAHENPGYAKGRFEGPEQKRSLNVEMRQTLIYSYPDLYMAGGSSPPNDLNGAQRLNGLNDLNGVNFGANRTHRRVRNNRRSHARWASGGRHRFRLSYGNNYNPRGVGILCDRAALYSQRARRRK